MSGRDLSYVRQMIVVAIQELELTAEKHRVLADSAYAQGRTEYERAQYYLEMAQDYRAAAEKLEG